MHQLPGRFSYTAWSEANGNSTQLFCLLVASNYGGFSLECTLTDHCCLTPIYTSLVVKSWKCANRSVRWLPGAYCTPDLALYKHIMYLWSPGSINDVQFTRVYKLWGLRSISDVQLEFTNSGVWDPSVMFSLLEFTNLKQVSQVYMGVHRYTPVCTDVHRRYTGVTLLHMYTRGTWMYTAGTCTRVYMYTGGTRVYTGCTLEVHLRYTGCTPEVHQRYTGVHQRYTRGTWMYTAGTCARVYMYTGGTRVYTGCTLEVHLRYTGCTPEVHQRYTGVHQRYTRGTRVYTRGTPEVHGCTPEVHQRYTGVHLRYT